MAKTSPTVDSTPVTVTPTVVSADAFTAKPRAGRGARPLTDAVKALAAQITAGVNVIPGTLTDKPVGALVRQLRANAETLFGAGKTIRTVSGFLADGTPAVQVVLRDKTE